MEESQPLHIVVQPAEEIHRPPEAYKNETTPHGTLFIANWNKFDDDVFPERHGSQNDVKNTIDLFTQIGYTHVTNVEDLTMAELLLALKEFIDHEIHSRVDSFIGVFMSHGKESEIAMRDGELIHVADVYDQFDHVNCPALVDKPKIFVFQHCRGYRTTASPSVDLETDETDGSGFNTIDDTVDHSHGISDAYILFSTRPRFVSYRDRSRGSVFIVELCRVLMERAKDTEMYHLISEINKELSKTLSRQRCDLGVLDHASNFYFNPIGAQLGASSSASQEPLVHLSGQSEGAAGSDFQSESQPGTSADVRKMEDSSSSPSGTPTESVDDIATAAMPDKKGQKYKSQLLAQSFLCRIPKRTLSYEHPTPDTVFSDWSLTHDSTSKYLSQTSISDRTPLRESEEDIYGFYGSSRGKMFVINNIQGCERDVEELVQKFCKLNYQVEVLPRTSSFQEMCRKINAFKTKVPSNVIVFFYGYGYGDCLFVGPDDRESVSYKRFCELFTFNQGNDNATVVFTNVCCKAKAPHTVTNSQLQDYIDHTFHVCVKVNGKCSNGSLLTKAVLEEFKANGTKIGFSSFACHVTCAIRHLQGQDPDSYITNIWYYGVQRNFYFSCPVEPPCEAKSTSLLSKMTEDAMVPYIKSVGDHEHTKVKDRSTSPLLSDWVMLDDVTSETMKETLLEDNILDEFIQQYVEKKHLFTYTSDMDISSKQLQPLDTGINWSPQSVDDDDLLLQKAFGDDYFLYNFGLSSSSQAESLPAIYEDPMHDGATGDSYASPFTSDDPIHYVFDKICSQGANRYDTPAGEPSTSFEKNENLVSDLDKLVLEYLDPDTIKEEPHGATAAAPQTLIPNEEVLGKIPATRRRRVRGPKNWEFLMRLLVDPRANPSLIEWEDEANATFRLKQPSIIAQMWGSRNPDQGDLTYNNFVRGLRYRFRTGQLIHIPGRQFVYGCGPKALEFLEELRQLRN